jgi:16S rRNA (uracil1498-N3)-methyltransferase
MDEPVTSSYTPPESISEKELVIAGAEFIHLTRVLRKRPGDVLRVVDGCGTACLAEITRFDRKSLVCRILERRSGEREAGVHLTLGVGLLKNPARFDVLVEKTTELGVAAIVPLTTERTITKWAKTERWQRIAVSAMVQSGRCVLPAITAATPLERFIESAPLGALRVIAHEEAPTPLLGVLPVPQRVVMSIGPEGGFTDAEISRARDAGFHIVSLGERRLRSETAAITSAALVLLHGGSVTVGEM